MRYLLPLVLAVGVWHVFVTAAPQLEPFCPLHATVKVIETVSISFGR